MSDDEPRRKQESGGAPKWMATFADLMSLLLAFFVLLFSFSSIEPALYKIIGGSMKDAFGVQRQVVLTQQVLGTSMVAVDYNGGPPTKKSITEIMQLTAQQYERFLKAESPNARMNVVQETKGVIRTAKKMLEAAADGKNSDIEDLIELVNEAQREAAFQYLEQGGQEVPGSISAMMLVMDALAEKEEEVEPEVQPTPPEDPGKVQDEGIEAPPAIRSMEREMKELKAEFAQEFDDKLYSLNIEGEGDLKQFRIRLAEQAGFATARAELSDNLKAFIKNLAERIKDSPLHTTVIGHTDSRPINTPRFRSNWDLSAARAVSVVHELVENNEVPPKKLSIKGLGSTEPIATNKTSEGQAQNRRVEIIIHTPGTL